MKQYKRFLIVFMCVAVLTGSMARPIQSKAVVPLVIGAWEVITILLLSAGVTYETYSLLDRTIPDDLKEEWVNQFIGQIKSVKEDAGEAIETFVNTYRDTAVTTMALSRVAWDSFRDALNTLFNGQDVLDAGGNVAYNFDSVESFLRVLGVSADAGSTIYTTAQQLMEYVNTTGEKVSAIAVARKDEYSGQAFNILAFTAPGALTFTANYNELSRLLQVQFSSNSTKMIQFSYSLTYGEWSTLDALRDWTSNKYSWYSTLAEPLPTVQTLMVGSDVAIKQKVRTRPGYESLLQSKDMILVTPGTQVVDGAITGDIIWTIPADLADVLNGVLDDVIPITDALAALKVIPADKTDEKAVEDAIDKVGGVAIPDDPAYDGDYTLNLSTFFPFCLPFDFVDFIKVLQATPEAPVVKFNMPVGYSVGGAVTYQEYEIDFSMFDTVAYVLRTMETLAFCVGLIIMTRNYFIRG